MAERWWRVGKYDALAEARGFTDAEEARATAIYDEAYDSAREIHLAPLAARRIALRHVLSALAAVGPHAQEGE